MTAWKILPLMAVAAFAQDQTGGIQGTVVDSVTHQPVRNASVRLQFSGPFNGTPHANQNAATNTGAGGVFRFDSVAAGSYFLIPQHPNYPQQRAARTRIEVKPGEIADQVTIELVPGGAISGHVYDEDGDPLRGCTLQAHPAAHPDQAAQSQSRNSGDDGEYRLFHLAAGKYKVSVRCSAPPFQPRPFSAGPDPAPSRAYEMQSSEAVIDVAPGSERTGVDFQMRAVAVTQVHGRFNPSGADWHGQQMVVELHPANGDALFARPPSIDQKDGTFEFLQVFPGAYTLTAVSIGNAGGQVGAMQQINVLDKPAEVELTLQHGAELEGRVTLEGPDSEEKVHLEQMQVQLMPEARIGFGFNGTQVKGDGAFTLRSVLPMRYRVALNGGLGYLKEAWLGNTDVTGKTFEISGPGAPPLRLVFSTNTATLSGTAPAGTTVLAAPVGTENFRGAQSDTTGHFTMTGLPPGRYRVVAGDRQEIIASGLEGGQEVTLGEGETATIDVKPQQ